VTRLCAARPTICGYIPGRVKRGIFPPPNCIRGSIQLSIKWLPLYLSSEIKRPGREADHVTPSTVIPMRTSGAIPPPPHMSSWHSHGRPH